MKKVASLTAWAIVVAIVMVAVVVVIVVKVLVCTAVDVDAAVELLVIGVWAGMMIGSLSEVVTGVVGVLVFLVAVSYFLEMLSGVMVKALAVGIGVEALADMNVNVFAAVMNTLDSSMLI